MTFDIPTFFSYYGKNTITVFLHLEKQLKGSSRFSAKAKGWAGVTGVVGTACLSFHQFRELGTLYSVSIEKMKIIIRKYVSFELLGSITLFISLLWVRQLWSEDRDFMSSFNVLDYGAIGDGITDDTLVSFLLD